MTDVTALALTGGDVDFRALAQLTGQDGAFSNASAFPRLRINTDFVTEDEDGTEYQLTPGAFVVADPEGRDIYAKTVKFRPLLNRFQYRRYDPKGGPDGKGATVAKTILISGFGSNGEEPIDDAGGVACGRLGKKEAAKGGLSVAQETIQAQTKAYRYVYGMVTIDGTLRDGTPAALEGYPCLLRMRGSNFMAIGDVFDSLAARKRLMQSVNLTLTTKREKNGDTTYYVIKYEYDAKEVLPLNETVVATIKDVLSEIEDHNKAVLEKHKTARKAPPRNVGGSSDLGSDFFEEGES